MKYININQKLNFKFCQVPRKILYTEPYKSILCPLSQLAYIFILDRLNLSRMNNKIDEYGNIYLFMTRKEMGENLKSSAKTEIKVFKELEKAKLIKQENQGKGKAYKREPILGHPLAFFRIKRDIQRISRKCIKHPDKSHAFRQ